MEWVGWGGGGIELWCCKYWRSDRAGSQLIHQKLLMVHGSIKVPWIDERSVKDCQSNLYLK